LGVPAREQRRRRHDRLNFAVTFGASSERIRGRRVLVRVARRAHAVLGFARCGMRGLHVPVAARASRGNGLLILVRAVTVQTRGRCVHGHGRDLALGLGVATCTISRAVRFESARARRARRARREERIVRARERMAIHAVCVHAGTEALLCQPGCVLNRRARGVARRTTNRRHGTQRSSADFVTLVARNMLLDHVHAVPGDAAVRAPIQLDVHALARRSALSSARPCGGTTDDQGEQHYAEQRGDGEPIRAVQDAPMIRTSNPTCDCDV
jgi:hypothetical protein